MKPVFVAASVREAEIAEKLLEEEGIDFELRPEAFLGEVPGACRQGLLFEVEDESAALCRRLFTNRGLGRGVVTDEAG